MTSSFFRLLVCALGLLGCGFASSAAQRQPGAVSSPLNRVVVVDTSAPYVAFWAAHAGGALESQVAAFAKDVAAGHPQLYGREILELDPKLPESAALAERLRLYLPAVEPELPRIRAVAAALPEDVTAAVASFYVDYPQPRSGAQVIITASLGTFDGMTAELEGTPTILLGVDGIALFHPLDYDVQPLIHHELFHLHHAERWGETTAETLGEVMWQEGLATYASELLNPDAPAREIFGDPALEADVAAVLPELARAASAQLDSRDPDILAAFLMGGVDSGMPQRCGYVLGAMVAETLAEHMSMDDLTALKGPELQTALRTTLDAFSPAPASP